MSHLDRGPLPPSGPPLVRVPSGGAPGRAAALIAVAALAVVVGVALLGERGDGSAGSAAVLDEPTTAPTPQATPRPTAVRTPSPRAGASPAAPEQVHPRTDLAGALPGDDGTGPLPLGTINELPNPDRLDFLFEFCRPGCFRDAHWMDPQNPKLGSGGWTAGRPFHVREGFVNDRAEPLGDGYDVTLYVTRMAGDRDEDTYRYTSDYVLRGTSDRCGPTYKTQTGPETCEWFVHDFPEGLPEGRFAITAAWEAPCRAWIGLGLRSSCRDPDEVISLFSSSFDAPYSRSGPSYTEESS